MNKNKLDCSSDYTGETEEYLSLEEEEDSLQQSDMDEMSDIEQEIINIKEEDEFKIKSILSHIPSSTIISNHSQDIKITNNNNEVKTINNNNNNEKTNLSLENNPNNDLNNAISRAKNIIVFFRALYNEYFLNIDPNYFVVISDGQLVGIYENEEKARQVASQTNINIGNQIGDGMVFPISGNFKQKRNSNDLRIFDFPNKINK